MVCCFQTLEYCLLKTSNGKNISNANELFWGRGDCHLGKNRLNNNLRLMTLGT